MRIDWKASLVPAAAVIPAPEAYANVAAVKKLVVCPWVVGLPGASSTPWETKGTVRLLRPAGGIGGFGGLRGNPQRFPLLSCLSAAWAVGRSASPKCGLGKTPGGMLPRPIKRSATRTAPATSLLQ